MNDIDILYTLLNRLRADFNIEEPTTKEYERMVKNFPEEGFEQTLPLDAVNEEQEKSIRELRKLGGQPREFTIKDVEVLENRIEQIEKEYGVGYIKAVIFNLITAFMGDIDEFKSNQVRAAFRPMARLADEKKFAWIGVGHPKKSAEQGRAKDAFSGSIA